MPERPTPQLHIAVCDDEVIDRKRAKRITTDIMEAEGLSLIHI